MNADRWICDFSISRPFPSPSDPGSNPLLLDFEIFIQRLGLRMSLSLNTFHVPQSHFFLFQNLKLSLRFRWTIAYSAGISLVLSSTFILSVLHGTLRSRPHSETFPGILFLPVSFLTLFCFAYSQGFPLCVLGTWKCKNMLQEGCSRCSNSIIGWVFSK